VTDPESFYEPTSESGCYVATELTRGPWSDGHQHGGPPAALLGHAIEQRGGDAAQWLVSRLTVELLRPVQIGRVRVQAEPVRTGGRVQWWDGRLLDETDELVARASATRIRLADVDLPAPRHPPLPRLPPPADRAPLVFPFFRTRLGYHTAVEVRLATGDWGHGPAAAWLRPRVPLVAGEPLTGLSRVVICADAANGVAYVLDPTRFAFINPDLTVTLGRAHVGEWVGLDTDASADAHGTGLCEARVHDEGGVMGRSAQSLVVRGR
jgi:hypothetical protein